MLLRHPADVHLEDLPCVVEQLVQAKDPFGGLVRRAGES